MLPRFLLLGLVCVLVVRAAPIDREAWVSRHHPVNRAVDFDAPLTVGNGGFAFTADITGLQTLAGDYHRHGVPTETLSRWCWVTDDNPQGYQLSDTNQPFRMADGRTLGFPTRQGTPAGEWLRRNPRSHPLGVLALEWDKADGSPLSPADIESPDQVLDLWRGVLTSRFNLGGVPVTVVTVCDPASDTVGVRVTSEWVERGRLRVRLAFPRGHDPAVKNTPGFDWSHPDRHRSELRDGARGGAVVRRTVGATTYHVAVSRPLRQAGAHAFLIKTPPMGGRELAFTVGFSSDESEAVAGASVDALLTASAKAWTSFWQTTAAVDFSGSTNPLAMKLERRVVLSRYLAAVQLVGDVPPQESGLTCNTWYGKHHTEMIWWHAAHFALWGQDAALEKNLSWYRAQLPAARRLAASRGLPGARWAKMTGPDLRESPGGNPLIVWNQPHPIYLAELLYRNRPTPELLATYRDLVLETAETLAGMLHWDAARGVYGLGPPLWIVQEIHDPATSQNPTFELAYWRWALGVAQQWRERLGLPREPTWDHAVAHLPPLAQRDGKYVALESHPDTWTRRDSRHDHPEMLMPLGVLPGGPDVDRGTMERTLDAVLAEWDWETKIWGWDYPMIAMTAARLGRPETAVEILLRDGPNNRYLPNGHCPQRSDEKMDPSAPPGSRRREIAVYLPANGAFLAAVALMVQGWDGCTTQHPGIPKDGTWVVRAEGLRPLP
ncbi:MAG TPA: hypothetical protein PKX00_04610 [Opitutaceae bacterium]|nr:hypothetical protein [Opitutaceae bacterium]